MTKHQVIETLDQLPEEFKPEDLMALLEKIALREKIEEGLKAADEGRTIPLSEVRRRFEEKWSKSK